MGSGSSIGRRGLAAAALALAACALAPAGASATFPGQNGVVTFAATVPTTSGDIFTVNPDGSDRKAITSSADADYSPSFSPDGERIVFTRIGTGPDDKTAIWVMNADGSGQTALLTGTSTFGVSSPTFSPDGNGILYAVTSGMPTTTNIWAMNTDGTGQRPVTALAAPAGVSQPAPSPDGSKIAVTYNTGAAFRIGVMNADGSGLTAVSPSSPGGSSQPDWSPDGAKIIFRNNRSIFEMSPTGSDVLPLTSAAGPPYDSGPVYSPQGTQFAFNRQGASSSGEVRLGTPGATLGATTPLATSSGGAGAGESLDWQPLNPPACELGSSKPAKSGKSISVSVSCAGENATVTIDGSGKAPKPKKGGGKGKGRKASKFTIPAVVAEVPAGASAEVVVTLPKKAGKAVKKATRSGKKAKATLNATFADGLGATVADSAKVQFKPKKKGK